MIYPLSAGQTLVFYGAIFSALFGIGEFIRSKNVVSGDVSRKIVHVTGGLTAATLPLFTHSIAIVSLLCCIYFALIFSSRKAKILKGIHDVSRPTVGAELFPLAVWISFVAAMLADRELMCVLAISILALSDTAAGVGWTLEAYNKLYSFRGKKIDRREWGVFYFCSINYLFYKAAVRGTLFLLESDFIVKFYNYGRGEFGRTWMG